MTQRKRALGAGAAALAARYDYVPARAQLEAVLGRGM